MTVSPTALGTAGSNLRNQHAAILNTQLAAAGKGQPPPATVAGVGDRLLFGAATKPELFFHPEIGAAVRDRPGGPPGLHNFAAFVGACSWP